MARVYSDFDQISGLFKSSFEVENLINELYNRGLGQDDISVLMSEGTRNRFFAMHEDTKLPEGAAVGGLSGGVLGAIVGGLTMVGTVLLPGVGLLAAGPVIGALAGGTIGAATGGLIGALVGLGIPEHEAKFYENALKEEGNVLVVARVPHDDADETRKVFERYHAEKLKVQG